MAASVSLGVTGRKLGFLAIVTVGALALGLGAPGTAVVAAQSPAPSMQGRPPDLSRSKWWKDAEVQKELGLTADKVKRIDDFFERRSKDMKPWVDRWQHEREVLDTMTRAATVDEATYALQVQEVQSLSARLGESRTMMLYRIYRELQPEQYKKLQEIFARRAVQNAGGNDHSGRGRE
jgi:Spy/CpxP family protein refolding chaperone